MAGRRGVGERDHLPPRSKRFRRDRIRPGLRRHRVCRGHLAARRRRVGRRGYSRGRRQDRGDFEFQKLELRAFPKDNGSNGLTLFADLRTYTPGGNRVTQGHEDTVRARFWAMDHEDSRLSLMAFYQVVRSDRKPGDCLAHLSVEIERPAATSQRRSRTGGMEDGRSPRASDVNGSRAWPADVASTNETICQPLPSDLAEIDHGPLYDYDSAVVNVEVTLPRVVVESGGGWYSRVRRQDWGAFEFRRLELRMFPKDAGRNSPKFIADLRTRDARREPLHPAARRHRQSRFFGRGPRRQSVYSDGLLSGRPGR